RALARTGPDGAVRTLTGRLAEALRSQIVEADDRRTLRLLGLLEELWREETGERAPDETARVAWLQRATRAHRLLVEREPERIAAFRRQLESFVEDLERAGLASHQLSRAYPGGVVARFVLREAFFLLVGAPLALVGMVLHAIPYQLTGAVVRRLDRTDEEEATDKIAAGLVLYPLAWTAEAAAV